MSTGDENIVVLAAADRPFSFYTIEALCRAAIDIDCIVIDTTKYKEKDKKIWDDRTGGHLSNNDFSCLESYGIPFFFFKNHNSSLVDKFLKDRSVSIIVNAGTPRILKKNILDIPKRGVVNVHPGILPKYRGCTVLEWAIYNNDKVGNTAHFMSEGIDEGPIILYDEYKFSKTDSYSDVRTKVYKGGFSLMARAVKKIINDDLCVSSLPVQGVGDYWDVMPDDKLGVVQEKLCAGQYKHQY
jgi:methionyl-tRNA formyltransferase